jgi:hypothetical protein
MQAGKKGKNKNNDALATHAGDNSCWALSGSASTIARHDFPPPRRFHHTDR